MNDEVLFAEKLALLAQEANEFPPQGLDRLEKVEHRQGEVVSPRFAQRLCIFVDHIAL